MTVTLITTSVWRVALDGTPREDLSDLLVSGEVVLDLDRTIKLTCTLALRDPWRVSPYRDYLAPAVRYDYEDGRAPVTSPLGIYAVRVPPGEYTGRTAIGTFAGEDLTSLLATSAYTAVDTVPSGTSVVTELGDTLAEAGITRTMFPASTRTFRKHWTFPAGTTRLDKCNRILQHIGWYEVFMGLDGRVGSTGTYIAPGQQQPVARWTEDVLLEAPREQPSDEILANVVIVVRDDPSEAALVAVARNDDPTSPTSTVSLGREIVRVERQSDLHSQQDANALAQRLLAEARLRYRTAEMVVDPDPRLLNPWQVVDIAFTDGALARFAGRWRVRGARLGLDPAEPAMSVTLSQITSETGVPV